MERNVNISVVIPLLNEEASLRELCSELKPALKTVSEDYEIIFIDDGSTDNSFLTLEHLHKIDPKIKVIQFRKNYGKSAALTVGFKEAKGTFVFTIDSDLQDDPKDIPVFLEELNRGYDLVSGWKVKRKDSLSKILASRLFNFMTSFMSGVRIHDFNCGFKCYKREVIENIKIYGELYRFIPVLAAWKGFKVGEIKIAHHPRRYGKSKFGLERFGRGLFDFLTILFLTKFAHRPLHFFGAAGLLLTISGLSICIYLTSLWFRGFRPIGNRPLLLLGVLLLISGIQFISIGLIGELITSKFHKEEEGYFIKERLI
jgi:glycosyltransferase involved in cell wall biosynthesis